MCIESISEINELCNLIHMMVKVDFILSSGSSKENLVEMILSFISFPSNYMNLLKN